MSLLNYIKQIWDTTSYVNPTRMNHIEDGIYDVSDKVDNLSAENIAYGSGNVKQALDNVPSFSTVTGNFASTIGNFSTINYPTGFSQSNSKVVGFEIEAGGYWRTGQGIYSASSRIFCYLGGSNIQCYNDDSNLVSANVRVTLMKYA